ncbi:MAG: general secretion pathway protein GspN [Burkholderiales bacterium PBB5]|nr:MAG: general secretion pathway protein GspN [Burkholderiales bacterium PBB5]
MAPGWAGYTLALLPVAPTGDAARASPAGAVPAPLGQWPAGWLAGLGAPFNTLGLGGTLRAASPGFTLQSVAGRLQLAGALQLELQDASSRVSPLQVLGSYRLLLQGQAQGGDTATVQLQTTDGALLLNGTGQWTGGRLRFRGAAQAAPGQDAVLANLLNIIGRRQGAVSVISIG